MMQEKVPSSRPALFWPVLRRGDQLRRSARLGWLGLARGPMPIATRGLVLSLLLSAPAGGTAQDANYWTYQFGTRSNLLGGAVVGSAVDLSATFYNPGALSLLDERPVIASTMVFELSRLSLAGGSELDLSELRFGEAPGFFAGTLPFAFLGSQVLAYSVLTRHRFKARLGETTVGVIDTLGLQGDFFGKIRFERDMDEQWFGLSWSARAGGFGVGLTQYVAHRSHRGTDVLLGEAFPARGGGAITLAETDFSYGNYRMLWKFGAAFEWMGASIGLTTTTPGVRLFGDGTLELNRTVFGQDPTGDGVPDPFFVAGFEKSIPSTYKSPWAVAVGTALRRGRIRVHLSAEYFGKVGEYKILDAEDFIGQTTGDTVVFDLTTALDPVLNVAVGLEHTLSNRFTGYASFWTDASARPDTDRFDPAISRWNLAFVSVGAAAKIGTSDLTFGLAFGFGGSDDAGDGSGNRGIDDELVGGVFDELAVDYRSLRFMIAFSI